MTNFTVGERVEVIRNGCDLSLQRGYYEVGQKGTVTDNEYDDIGTVFIAFDGFNYEPYRGYASDHCVLQENVKKI